MGRRPNRRTRPTMADDGTVDHGQRDEGGKKKTITK
jgi:hypothetical protein